MEDSTEPYLAGLKYHAMPPLKRFRDMEHLSGGEKTIAALALLFAIHSYQPSPFFVLDEVDAALDHVNVGRVASYVREHASPGMQFIVISLKSTFFQESETLVGVMRDQSKMTSKYLSLDVSLPVLRDFVIELILTKWIVEEVCAGCTGRGCRIDIGAVRARDDRKGGRISKFVLCTTTFVALHDECHRSAVITCINALCLSIGFIMHNVQKILLDSIYRDMFIHLGHRYAQIL
jgi:energy-coupling factor transporter ATP-binding protein EcfA2